MMGDKNLENKSSTTSSRHSSYEKPLAEPLHRRHSLSALKSVTDEIKKSEIKREEVKKSLKLAEKEKKKMMAKEEQTRNQERNVVSPKNTAPPKTNPNPPKKFDAATLKAMNPQKNGNQQKHIAEHIAQIAPPGMLAPIKNNAPLPKNNAAPAKNLTPPKNNNTPAKNAPPQEPKQKQQKEPAKNAKNGKNAKVKEVPKKQEVIGKSLQMDTLTHEQQIDKHKSELTDLIALTLATSADHNYFHNYKYLSTNEKLLVDREQC